MKFISSTLLLNSAISSSRSWNLRHRAAVEGERTARHAGYGGCRPPLLVVQLDGGQHCKGGRALHVSNNLSQLYNLLLQPMLNVLLQLQHLLLALRQPLPRQRLLLPAPHVTLFWRESSGAGEGG